MKHLYIAGPISNTDCLKFLSNIRKGIELAKEALLWGFAPFCPFLDFQYFLSIKENEEITLKMIQAYSMAWLEKSDAILVLPEHERSLGTLAEIAKAKELNIPVHYYSKTFKWKEIL